MPPPRKQPVDPKQVVLETPRSHPSRTSSMINGAMADTQISTNSRSISCHDIATGCRTDCSTGLATVSQLPEQEGRIQRIWPHRDFGYPDPGGLGPSIPG